MRIIPTFVLATALLVSLAHPVFSAGEDQIALASKCPEFTGGTYISTPGDGAGGRSDEGARFKFRVIDGKLHFKNDYYNGVAGQWMPTWLQMHVVKVSQWGLHVENPERGSAAMLKVSELLIEGEISRPKQRKVRAICTSDENAWKKQ